MFFPTTRLRRLRISESMRNLVRETHIRPEQLIQPFFVEEGTGIVNPISSMPGINRYSPDTLIEEIKKCEDLGIGGILLFGIPGSRNENATGAWDKNGIIQKTVREIKKQSDIFVITDLCLCEYMSHGHCGIVENGCILNDPTLELLAKTALSQAEAGADMIAPSDMMDGRIGAVRHTLDHNGFEHLPVMSYAAKFASGFYGPFREAAESAPAFGDRKTYQMDPANGKEALREIEQDIDEGADIIMVKPALPYLDVIKEASTQFKIPVAAYQVSGEYLMIRAASEKGYIDENQVIKESLVSIKRAGAEIIISYFTRKAVESKII